MIPDQLQNKNINFVLLKEKEKIPFQRDWQNKIIRYDDLELLEHIKNKGNFGVRGGGALNLIIVDFDNEEVQNKVIDKLPKTFTVKTGGGLLHKYFFSDDCKSFKIFSKDMDTFADIQGEGKQCVGPGSIHPNGNEYQIVDDSEIEYIDYSELKALIIPFDEKPKKEVKEQLPKEYDGNDFIEQVKRANTLSSVLSDFGVNTSKNPTNCPLHSSKGGQCFGFNDETFHCFHCEESGNIFTAVTKFKGCEFKEALEYLVEKAGLQKEYEEQKNKFIDKQKVNKEDKNKEKEEKKNYTSSIIDEENKIIVEQVYDEKQGSFFCIYNHKTEEIKYLKTYNHNGKIYHPHVGDELEKGAILLPTRAENYNEEDLNKRIEDHINHWLDVPKETVKFGVWNTKRSWVYEAFHSLNYLRAQGDTGLGKSRYLNTFGSIHYKPIFTSGSTTPAPLFRIIDKWRGTLVMDEADLKESDETNETIKIINQGFEKNSFILRCDQVDASKINFFDPFCPKILATRRSFGDKATESRCITHVMAVTERKDIPVNLNKEFYKESQEIRNQLLMWRFKNYFEIDLNKKFDLGDLEPRVKQIVSSYVALFGKDEKQMEEFKDFIEDYQDSLIEERQSSFEGSIVGAIHSLLKYGERNITAQKIVNKGEITGRNGKPMQPRGLTSYLKSLGFKQSSSVKINGKTERIVPIDEKHIKKLFTRYGYEVTVVTVVTETPQFNNINDTKEIGDKKGDSTSHRYQRNDRNSVTEDINIEYVKIGQKDEKEVEK